SNIKMFNYNYNYSSELHTSAAQRNLFKITSESLHPKKTFTKNAESSVQLYSNLRSGEQAVKKMQFSWKKEKKKVKTASPGNIVPCHYNCPEKQSFKNTKIV
ncbi:hypothetical protein ACJX0J_010225, partial [Zea mays]